MPGDNDAAKITDKIGDLRDDAVSSVKSKADAATEAAKGYRDAAADAAKSASDTVSSKADDLKASAASIANDLRTRTEDHIGEAKSAVSAIADDARSSISDIVDRNKAVGADKLSNLSEAAKSAADNLDSHNPQVARVVRQAATSVDQFAGDLRAASLSEIAGTVTSFARRQPVAFFAGTVLVGFAIARFLRSDSSRSS